MSLRGDFEGSGADLAGTDAFAATGGASSRDVPARAATTLLPCRVAQRQQSNGQELERRRVERPLRERLDGDWGIRFMTLRGGEALPRPGRTTSMLRTHCDPRRCKREPVPIRDPCFPGPKCTDPPLEALQRGSPSRSDSARDSPGASRARPGLGQPLRNRAGCLVVSHGSSARDSPCGLLGTPERLRVSSAAGGERHRNPHAPPRRLHAPRAQALGYPGGERSPARARGPPLRLTPGGARPARSAWGAARTRAARAARPRGAPPRGGCVDVRGG